jgi:hypothetical protein
MVQKARKFKKKLAVKSVRRKAEPVLSVELIKKESLEKLNGFLKKLLSKFKSFKLAN